MASEAKASVRRHKMYINGEFVESQSGKYFPIIDPSTEDILAEVPDADEKDVNRAVAAAKAAFDSGAWPQTTAQERGRILFRLAERVRKEAAGLVFFLMIRRPPRFAVFHYRIDYVFFIVLRFSATVEEEL